MDKTFLYETEIELDNISKLLACFTDFCANEGLSFENNKTNYTLASFFIDRLNQYISILFTARDEILTLKKQVAEMSEGKENAD